ncbi:hypothetical protein [Haloarchaeobius sp. HME9146]|uniref:hypothetical protein n=1 Tax=Haloarchaeobius sp. HME9146 TaxID=2978732 RepID=UPI0021C090F1|nr:hypothetical protein [Haloarchaeobius sp. HME9146]MCT9095883.1 hypothetical protein [Haloarchaeobius sp. HME9146]
MSDSSPSTTTRLAGVRPMLLGIAAILTGGILTIQALITQQTGLPPQSPLADGLVKGGFVVVVLGFLYGVLTGNTAGDSDSE